MTAPDPDEIARLTALASWQRGEIDRLRARASADLILERATGILMERLGCPADQARQQLIRLAAEAGTTPAEMAADIAGQALAAVPSAQRSQITTADAVMAAAPDAGSLAEALLADALTAEGAEAVALWLLAPEGGMDLAGQAGFGLLQAARWRHIPPGVPFPALRALHHDTEIWWPAGPSPGDSSLLIGQNQGAARAVVPLRQAGRCFGALEACWPAPLDEFTEQTRRQLTALAVSCAQLLSAGLPPATPAYPATWLFGLLDALRARALYARAVRDDHDGLIIEWASEDYRDPQGRTAGDVTGHHLLEIYPAAARRGGLPDAAAQVLASGQPRHLPGMPLAAAGAAAEVTIAPLSDGVIIAWHDPGEAGRLAALLEQAQWLGRIGSWEENLATGQVYWDPATSALFGLPPGHPVPLGSLHERVPAEDLPAVQAFQHRAIHSPEPAWAAFRIIRGDDASIRQLRAIASPVTSPAGDVIAVRGAYQDVSAQYHTQTAFTLTQQQLADTEQRVTEERQLATQLQRAITPQVSQPVEAAGIDVAARYRPAGQQHLVGGDWYDAVLLPSKQVLLAIGDVAGHGITAVTGMVALRNYLRGLAITSTSPAALLTLLNSAALHLAGTMATVICGIYDPPTRTLHWARAGHLPPLLIRDGRPRTLALPSGVLVGADPDATYQEAVIELQLGDTVVLFTDGLIERRGQTLDDALATLTRLATRPAPSISEFASHLIEHTPSDTGDDTCLLAIRIR